MIYRINKKYILRVSILLIALASKSFVAGQDIVNREIEKFNGLNWTDWVDHVEKEYNLKFYYEPNTIPDFKVNIAGGTASFKEGLVNVLQAYSINVSIDSRRNVFLLRNKEIKTSIYAGFYNTKQYADETGNTTEDYLNTHDEIITKTKIVGDENRDSGGTALIRGVVKDFQDSSLLYGATIFIEEINKAYYTNKAGAFSVRLKKGEYVFIVRGIENNEEKFKVIVHSSGDLVFYLEKKLILIDEIVITSDKSHNVRSNQMGVENITAKKIELIPAVLGEKDILKVSLMLPGIQSVGEGSAGINVRGAPADQNVFYLDNIPIYNTSHFFGFFSSLNSDALDNMKIYKSNIPSEYGGKLSAVVDIDTKRGNSEKFSLSGGISPITARLTVEGPIKKGKGSFLVGGRSTYSDWVLSLIDDPDISGTKAKFADGIFNLAYDINERNSVKLTGYYSYDKIDFAGKSKYDYENKGLAASWRHFYNGRNDTEVSLVFSDYASTEENYEDTINPFKQNFEINHIELKVKNSISIDAKHSISFGLNSIYYYLDKGSFNPLNEESSLPIIDFGISKAIETGVFINHEWNVLPAFSIMTGVRGNIYVALGPDEIYEYQENATKKRSTIVDTFYVGNNSVIKTYINPDFRISGKYLINKNNSVKISYNSLHQYNYMLSNTIAISPFYKWQLSDYHIKPMSGQQISAGFYSNLKLNKYEFSVEAYYKKINNLVQFKDGANITYNEIIETDVLQGKLAAYGMEISIKKKFGRLNGSMNYTYANAQNIVESKILEDNINYGLAYNADYDKTHAFNFFASYMFFKRLTASTNFVYSTGRPITYPTGVYYYNEQKFFNYTQRNEYRIPDYIRVDASIKYEGNLHAKKILHGTWILSVYNLLGRNNAYSVFFEEDKGVIKSYKLSIFANPVVSLSYNFNLGNYANK